MEKREKWIDYTKLFACILVVIGHLLQGLNKADIKWNQALYTNINNYIYIFHMPLFMCLSGYLYGKYTTLKTRHDYIKFIKKKVINLGVPYITFYLVTVGISMIFSNSVNGQKGISDIIAIFTHPISPYWFLYTLLFIFIVIPIIEYLFKEKVYLITILLLLFHIINILVPTNIYIVNKLAAYLIYFYIGKVFSIKKVGKSRKGTVLLYLIVFNFLSILICYLKNIGLSSNIVIRCLTLLAAILSLFAFTGLFKKYENNLKSNKAINFLSEYTMPIFLMHTIFSAGIRIFLMKINIYNFYIQFIFGLSFGIFLPIFTMKIFEYTKYLEFFVYPLNTLKKIKK